MMGLPDADETLMICLAVSTEYQRVTDGRTDILPRHSPRYAYASSVKNYAKNSLASWTLFIYSVVRNSKCRWITPSAPLSAFSPDSSLNNFAVTLNSRHSHWSVQIDFCVTMTPN